MAPRNKIDSNETTSYIAEEETIGKLPAVPVWNPLEPNSYDDFGGKLTLLARNPINASRQRKKGNITDLEASGGFNQDMTQENAQGLLQGFMFANARRKGEEGGFPVAGYSHGFTAAATTDNGTIAGHPFTTGDGPFHVSSDDTLPAGLVGGTAYWLVSTGANTFKFATSRANALAGTTIDITSNGTGSHTIIRNGVVLASDDTFTVNDPAGFFVGAVVLASGFANEANNGLHRVSSVVGAKIGTPDPLTDEPYPPAGARLVVVAIDAAAGDITVSAVDGEYPRITSTALDFSGLGMIAGEWIFVGGDDAALHFAEDENNGFKRLKRIEAHALTIDKSTLPMTTDAGTGKTVRIWLGRVIKNELGDLIVRRSYHLERQLGRADTSDPYRQAEYLTGSVPSEATLNVKQADKLDWDFSFVSIDHKQRTGDEGPIAGTRLPLVEADALNTSSDFSSLRLAIIEPGNEAPDALFGFVTDMKLSIDNNLSVNKAIGVIGGFDVTAGTFAVSMSVTAYFTDVRAVQAVRNNADVTVHATVVKHNAGFVVDLPLGALSAEGLDVKQDEPIMLPISMDAATAIAINPESDYTLLWTFFDRLPALARPE